MNRKILPINDPNININFGDDVFYENNKKQNKKELKIDVMTILSSVACLLIIILIWTNMNQPKPINLGYRW